MNMIYLGRDNALDRKVYEGATPADLSAVTKLAIEEPVSDTLIDSDAKPDAFDWSAGAGTVRLILGRAGLTAGRKRLRLIAFAPHWPHGLVLGTLDVRIVD